jgi:hypothetical protein
VNIKHSALAAASLLGLSMILPMTLPTGLTAGVVAAAPALSRPSHSDHHTRHLQVVPVSDLSTSNGFVAVNNDLNASGEQVGSDVTTCRGQRTQPQLARCDVALALSGGIIEITFTMKAGVSTAKGVVTGGTGTFRGASGTVEIHELGGSRADVTLTLTN